MSTLALNRLRPYSEIIELAPWDFCDNSILPKAIVRHCCDVHQRHLGHYYFNIFNRIKDKRVTYEIPLININILNEDIEFLDERRLLFETRLWLLNKQVLQIKIDIFKSTYPFQKIATSACIGTECIHDDPENWPLGRFNEALGVSSELSELLPLAEESIVENTQSIINYLESEENWADSVVTSHIMIQDYCEYGYMAAFMNYITPLIEIGRRELAKKLKKDGIEPPKRLLSRRDYKNWKLWFSIKKALFLDDEIELKSSYMMVNEKEYYRHDLYLKKPKILKQVIIEEFA